MISNIASTVQGARPKPLASTWSLDGTEKFYKLSEEQLSFFKTATGIEGEDELKAHVIAVQHEAYKHHTYPCIANFSFTRLKLSELPGYARLLELGKTRQGALYLDVGCCFGTDVRKAVVDGYPVENIIATDVIPEFWTLGHKLFNTTPTSFPVPFLAGDAFDPAFLEITPPASNATTTPPLPTPSELASLTSLNPLRGRVSAISICHVFHLFASEDAQTQLARAIAGLLSPAPGSTIVGQHAGRPEKGLREERGRVAPVMVFYHSPESWADLWDGEVFEKGTVRVEARLVSMTDETTLGRLQSEFWFMEWSVTRV